MTIKTFVAMAAAIGIATIVQAVTPADEQATYETNFLFTVQSSTGTVSVVVLTNRPYRVEAHIISNTSNPLNVSRGLIASNGVAVLYGIGSVYSIVPPIKYSGPISVRNTTTNATDTVTVIETWRTYP
jgi:hypothetical protein